MRLRDAVRDLKGALRDLRNLPPEAEAAHDRRLHAAGTPRRLWAPCGARTRLGSACRARPVRDRLRPWLPGPSGRCRNHGGLSTGPKTPEGRARIAAAARARWVAVALAEGRERPSPELSAAVTALLEQETLRQVESDSGFSRRQLERLASGRFCSPWEIDTAEQFIASRPEGPAEARAGSGAHTNRQTGGRP